MRHLAHSVDELDRANLMRTVLGEIERTPDLPHGLAAGFSIFGAAHLPPLLLEFFLALARCVPLRFYQPNPCLDYWGDIVSDRERLRRSQLWRAHGRREDEAYLHSGHPLLASWGALGREFLKAIHAPDLVVHDDDAFAAPASPGLLGWLQHGILLLDPQHAPPPMLEPIPSVQLHRCASRRREVEVLRDQLLRLLETLDDLLPHEIVVMSPRIEEYAPYIAAVFGDTDALSIPYGISDVPLRATHPLIDAFARILGLGESRITVSEIRGFLAEPAIARRFADEGASLVLTDISASRLKATAEELTGKAPLVAHRADVTARDEALGVVEAAAEDLGHGSLAEGPGAAGGVSQVRERLHRPREGGRRRLQVTALVLAVASHHQGAGGGLEVA